MEQDMGIDMNNDMDNDMDMDKDVDIDIDKDLDMDMDMNADIGRIRLILYANFLTNSKLQSIGTLLQVFLKQTCPCSVQVLASIVRVHVCIHVHVPELVHFRARPRMRSISYFNFLTNKKWQ